MNKKVFISGSISLKKIPACVESSIQRIKDQNITILVGDADGIDFLVQKYCKKLNYSSVYVYSIYSSPRYIITGFNQKHVVAGSDIKKERDRQKEKDEEMTMDSDYSLVIWDGKSKGSYQNILRAIENDKKVKVYLNDENNFLENSKINSEEITSIFRKNNGYSAAEVVEYLKSEGENYFNNTRAFNKYLMKNGIIKKEEGIYQPMPQHEQLIIIDEYRGKIKGIKFNTDFIAWIVKWIKEKKSLDIFS